MTYRRAFTSVYAALAILLLASPARAQMRLEGLDRLYFDHVAGPGAALPSSVHVAARLPETVSRPGASPRADAVDPADDIAVRDIAWPSTRPARTIWIREVVDYRHPRIAELWWALYDEGRRGDVWHFTAMPTRTENKLLGNYNLEGITLTAPDTAVFRVRSEMFRPMGAWWIAGKVWTFAVSDRALTFTRALNLFSFSQGYDTGDAPGRLRASIERETGGRFEIRALDDIPDTVRRECGFEDPGDSEFVWARLDTVARCITGKPGAVVTFRALNAPSFIERGK